RAEQVARGVEGRIGAQRGEGRAARVHVGRGLEDADRHAVHLTLGETSALAAAERGEAPVRGERVGQPEARIVPRRRVLGPRVAEADDGAQASALFAALGLLRLLGLGRRRSRPPPPPPPPCPGLCPRAPPRRPPSPLLLPPAGLLL